MIRKHLIRCAALVGIFTVAIGDGRSVSALDGCPTPCWHFAGSACIPDNLSHCQAIIWAVCDDVLKQAGPDCELACRTSHEGSHCQLGSPFNGCPETMVKATCDYEEA